MQEPNDMRQDELEAFILTEAARRPAEIDSLGPTWSPREWIGQLTPATRKRCERAIQSLERDGRILVTRNDSGKITNLKLSHTDATPNEAPIFGGVVAVGTQWATPQPFEEPDMSHTEFAEMSEIDLVDEMDAREDALAAPDYWADVDPEDSPRVQRGPNITSPPALAELPETHKLFIRPPKSDDLSPDSATWLADHRQRSADLLVDIEELEVDRSHMLANGLSQTVAEILAAGKEFNRRRNDLEQTFRELFVERFEIVAAILPEFEQFFYKHKDGLEEAYKLAIDLLAQRGVTSVAFGSLSGGDVTQKMKTHLAGDEIVLKAKERLLHAEAERDTMRAIAEAGRRESHTVPTIKWAPVSDALQCKIADLAGVLVNKPREVLRIVAA